MESDNSRVSGYWSQRIGIYWGPLVKGWIILHQEAICIICWCSAHKQFSMRSACKVTPGTSWHFGWHSCQFIPLVFRRDVATCFLVTTGNNGIFMGFQAISWSLGEKALLSTIRCAIQCFQDQIHTCPSVFYKTVWKNYCTQVVARNIDKPNMLEEIIKRLVISGTVLFDPSQDYFKYFFLSFDNNIISWNPFLDLFTAQIKEIISFNHSRKSSQNITSCSTL